MYLDLVYDESSFEKFFKFVDPADILKSHLGIPEIDNEIKLQNLKIVDKDFIFEVETGLQALQTYFIKEYGSGISFSYVSH